jgi:hypothetical protein
VVHYVVDGGCVVGKAMDVVKSRAVVEVPSYIFVPDTVGMGVSPLEMGAMHILKVLVDIGMADPEDLEKLVDVVVACMGCALVLGLVVDLEPRVPLTLGTFLLLGQYVGVQDRLLVVVDLENWNVVESNS